MSTLPIVKHANQGEWLDVLGMQIKFLCTSDDTQGSYSSMINTVPKGLGAPPHKHPWDESFYVLKGQVALRIDENRYQLSEGDYALVPANSVHAFEGLSEEEGLLIAFESPSHSQEFFKEIHDTVQNLPDDIEKMPGIGERHSVTFVA
jgi:quercetin dioxygenase-like cupin family protein